MASIDDASGQISQGDALTDLARLSDRLDVPVASTLSDREPAADFLERVPIGFARQHAVLGLASSLDSRDDLDVAIGRLASWQVLDVLQRFLRRTIRPILAPEAEVLSAINVAYQLRSGESQKLVDGLSTEDPIEELKSAVSTNDLLDSVGRPPVIQLVNSLLFEAIRAGASDVHVQPLENEVLIRQRIDGVLFDALFVPKEIQDEVISRLKILGKMNIAEKRLPQDGRATVHVGDRLIDLRIASLPTAFGERVVVRFLDKSARLYTLGELGMDSDTLCVFQRLIRREHGLLLATGPTGSGKSTTLYAALQEIDWKDKNVLTLEDPIEYQLEGISQTQINVKKGMTFAKGLRNILRQDPDIIMVGEIRDRETAEMAIQSALTGHLVFSTLHTNDAASAVTRLLDLGIEPYLVASSLISVVAQRLVRRTCHDCQHLSAIKDGESNRFECECCRNTGYSGRIGIFELLNVDDNIRELIQKRANATQIGDMAVRQGMKRLVEDGKRKVKERKTSMEEVLRVTAVEVASQSIGELGAETERS